MTSFGDSLCRCSSYAVVRCSAKTPVDTKGGPGCKGYFQRSRAEGLALASCSYGPRLVLQQSLTQESIWLTGTIRPWEFG
jgi:hypothetical protein